MLNFPFVILYSYAVRDILFEGKMYQFFLNECCDILDFVVVSSTLELLECRSDDANIQLFLFHQLFFKFDLVQGTSIQDLLAYTLTHVTYEYLFYSFCDRQGVESKCFVCCEFCHRYTSVCWGSLYIIEFFRSIIDMEDKSFVCTIFFLISPSRWTTFEYVPAVFYSWSHF